MKKNKHHTHSFSRNKHRQNPYLKWCFYGMFVFNILLNIGGFRSLGVSNIAAASALGLICTVFFIVLHKAICHK